MSLFKFSNEGGADFIREINSSEIEKEYNCYGLFYKNTDFAEELNRYRLERNEFIASFLEGLKEEGETVTLSDIKEQIESFQDSFEYESQKESCLEGRPNLFVEITDSEDCYYTDPIGFYTEACESSLIEDESEVDVYSSFVNEWDGRNWRKTTLSCEHGHCEVEDVTEEYEDSFNRKIEVGSSKSANSTNWDNYYYDVQEKRIFVESVSLWVGSVDSFTIVEDEDEIDFIFAKYADNDTVKKQRPEMFERHGGENLEVYRKSGYEVASQDEYFNESSHLVVFSEDNLEELSSWVNDPYNRTSGGTKYRLPSGIEIEYTWSAYQSDWCGFSAS